MEVDEVAVVVVDIFGVEFPLQVRTSELSEDGECFHWNRGLCMHQLNQARSLVNVYPEWFLNGHVLIYIWAVVELYIVITALGTGVLL